MLSSLYTHASITCSRRDDGSPARHKLKFKCGHALPPSNPATHVCDVIDQVQFANMIC